MRPDPVKREVVLDVFGTPAPKGSVRPVIRGDRAFLTPSGGPVGQRKLKAWDRAVREAAIEADMFATASTGLTFVGVALEVEIAFRLRRPAGHFGKSGAVKPSAPKHPSVKPDIDKLARLTLDALTGTLWDDDSRIVLLLLAKVYAEPGREGARIVVRERVP